MGLKMTEKMVKAPGAMVVVPGVLSVKSPGFAPLLLRAYPAKDSSE
jgi:hypothetical protein